jgi:hypothetical protein
MGNPCPDASIDCTTFGDAGAPAITQAAKAVAEAPHVVLRQPSPTVGVQHEAEEACRLARRNDPGLAGMKAQPAPLQELGATQRRPETREGLRAERT